MSAHIAILIGWLRAKVAMRRHGKATGSASSTNRRLRRNVSGINLMPVTIQRRFCIQGGKRKAWMVLPTLELNGRLCTGFTKRQAWLHNIVQGSGYSRSSHAGAIVNLVNECTVKFRLADPGVEPMQPAPVPLQEGEAPRQAEQEDGCGAEQQLVAKKGKRAIFSESEAEEDEAPTPRVRSMPKRRRLGAKRGDFRTLDIRGKPLTFTVLQGPRIVVPVDGPWIQQLIDDLMPRGGEQERTDDGQSTGPCPKFMLQPLDRGRIYWRSSTGAIDPSWLIAVKDADGKRRCKRAGLTVPRRALSGDMLSHEAFLHNAELVLRRARSNWNAWDTSSLARYDI